MTKVRSLAANQTVIEKTDGTMILVSYSTPVAAFIPGQGYLKTETRHSVTTSKHVTRWTEGRATARPQAFFDALL